MTGPSPEPRASSTVDSKLVQFRACQTCRLRKVKCVPSPSSESCDYCQKHNVECLPIVPTSNKRKRQGTSQADLKLRVEQLEEKLKLSEALNEETRHTSLEARYDGLASPPRSASLVNPQQSGLSSGSHLSSGGTFVPGHVPPDRDASFSVLDHREPSLYNQQFSPMNFNRNPQTLPPPNIVPIMRNSQSAFSPSGPPNCFSPVLEGYNQQRGQSQYTTPDRIYNNPVANPRNNLGTHIGNSLDAQETRQSFVVTQTELDSDHITESTQVVPMTRLVGPMAPFDSTFYELCIREGLATHDDRDCPRKGRLWARLFRLSNDVGLPIYKVQFGMPQQSSLQLKTEVSIEALAQVNKWRLAYGDVLVETFKEKVIPRYGLANLKELQAMSAASIDGQSMSLVCATFALAAQAVSSWSLKKRMYLGTEFYRFATTYLDRDQFPVTLDTLRILVLLAEFPLQAGTPLLNSCALAHAFDLHLNVDPEHWNIAEDEKLSRRRLFWFVILSDRFFTIQQHSPSLEPDYYDTQVPAPRSISDQINLRELEITELMSKITRGFYSVRGARMAHDNTAAASALCKLFEQLIEEAQAKIDKQFPAVSRQDSTTCIGVAMLHIHLTVCTIMIHRPFYENRNIGLMESLEHHRKACSGAIHCINMLADFPDSYFTELWPMYTRYVLVTVTLTLLREARLSPDEALQRSARAALVTLAGVFRRQADRWYLVNFMKNLMALSKALIGDEFAYEPEVSTEPMPVQTDTTESPWSALELEQFSAMGWDDMSQIFGMTAAPDWWNLGSGLG